MATIFYRKNQQGRKRSQPYITFSFLGRRYRRSLGAVDHRTAMKILAKVEVSMLLVQTGMARLPKGVCAGDFLFACRLNASPSPIFSRVTLARLVEEYLQFNAPPVKSQSTWKIEKVHLKHCLNVLGNVPLHAIDITMVEKYRKIRCAGVSPITVNKEIATLRLALAWAQKKGWIDENPVTLLSPLKTRRTGPPFCTTDEIKAHLAKGELAASQKRRLLRFRLLGWEEIEWLIALAWQYDPEIAPVIMTAAYTGMRRGELCRLKWEDVDLGRGIIKACSAKQSRRHLNTQREIPIHPALGETLRVLQNNASGRWVFIKGGKAFTGHTLTYYFKKLIRNTPLQGLGLHALRHAFASHLADAGVDQRVINELMGHTTEQISQRYRHLFPKTKRRAIEALGGELKHS